MATNQVNGKSYIGQTKRNDLTHRQREHYKKARSSIEKYTFHYAILKYGEENFSWKILEECDNDILDEREIFWIQYYDIYNSGYNETKGGDNIEALQKWRDNHPELVKEYAINALEKANRWNKEHREEHLKQLEEARKKALKKVCVPVRNIELNLVFDSMSKAEEWSKSSANPNGQAATHQSISKVCNPNVKRYTSGGYHWEYA